MCPTALRAPCAATFSLDSPLRSALFSLGYPLRSALFSVGLLAWLPFAVGPPLSRPSRSVTLCDRFPSQLVFSLGPLLQSALPSAGLLPRSPFVVGPPFGRSSFPVAFRRRSFFHPATHNPRLLPYSLRWTETALGNGGLLT
ncbi:hypothetical protein HYC85_030006 [Camellia sinensis]|uniref:Uncharacterized protein n=1 Tax=Camellia sinensis TaxID=4442 RepID=A0A7J7G0A8_CAMSI|nr:hypothetical protein HYC85_030006 [Camellia sinensis]